MSVSVQQLRSTFTEQGLLDTSILADPSVWGVYGQVLDELLTEALAGFTALCALPERSWTFAQAVEPYHALDAQLKMAWLCADAYNATDGNEVTAKLIEEYQPKIVRYFDEMLLNEDFYRILTFIETQEADTLTDVQARSLTLLLRDRRIAGVHLPSQQKARLREINERLTAVGEIFTRNTVESRKTFFHHFTSDELLQEFPEQDLDAAQEEAKNRGLDGWVFTLAQPARIAIARYCPDSAVCERFSRANTSVATEAPYDNRPLLLEMLRLRREKAELLGFQDYAQYVLQARMAANAEEVRAILSRFGDAYRAKAVKDIAELQSMAAAPLNMWDVAYHARKVLKQRYDIDEAELQQYFELEASLKGLFTIVQRLFGIQFEPLQKPCYGPDVRIFTVQKNGRHVGHLLLDLFTRPSKRAGAWCTYLRGGRLAQDGTRIHPLVNIVANFPKASEGKPTLLSHLDLETLFHECGHALHQLLSEHQYPNLESFATELDFVELPSQLLENWCWEEPSLSLFACHVETGEPMPAALLAALKARRSFLSGYEGCQQLAYAGLDLDLHTQPAPSTPEALDAFCVRHEQFWSILPIPEWFRLHASFTHVFGGEYAVGYYSYLWSEMLEADAFGLFEEEGILSEAAGERYRAEILAPGAMKTGKELFRSFRGRDADPALLLRKKGA